MSLPDVVYEQHPYNTRHLRQDYRRLVNTTESEGHFMSVDLNRQIVLVSRALYFAISEEWAGIAMQYNLSSAQQHVLYILACNEEPLTITEISQYGCWHISTVTRLLKPLLNEGYISITKGKGKFKYVHLTKSGKLTLKSIAEDVFHRNNFPLNFGGIESTSLEQFVQIGLEILKNQKGSNFSDWVKTAHPVKIGVSLD